MGEVEVGENGEGPEKPIEALRPRASWGWKQGVG